MRRIFCLLAVFFVAILINSDAYTQVSGLSSSTYADLQEALTAARNKDLYKLRNMMNMGLDINKPDGNGDTIYCTAVRQKDVDTANILKQFGGSYKGCPGIDPDVERKRAAANVANKPTDGIFTGLKDSGTVLLLAGAGIAGAVFLFSGSDDDSPPPAAGSEGGNPPYDPTIPASGTITFNMPNGNGRNYIYNEESDRSTTAIYQSTEYDFITLNKYSAIDFDSDFAYTYDYYSRSKELIPKNYSIYDAIHVNILRALGYNGTKYTRVPVQGTSPYSSQTKIVPPADNIYTSIKLALISASGLDKKSPEFRISSGPNAGNKKWGFSNGKIYNENSKVVYSDSDTVSDNPLGFTVNCSNIDALTLTCYDSSGNVVSTTSFTADSKATGIVGIIGALENNGGMVGIAPATLITAYQTRSYPEGLEDPYITMKNALNDENNVILFTDVAPAITVANFNGKQIPVNLPNSETLYSILKENGGPVAKEYFLNMVNNLYVSYAPGASVADNVNDLYSNFPSLSINANKRPVFIFPSGDDNMPNASNIESSAPMVYTGLIGNFINVVAVDENRVRYTAQQGSKTGAGDTWLIGSNGCGSTKNWCISAPGKNIIAPASGTQNLKQYAEISNMILNLKAYQVTNFTGSTNVGGVNTYNYKVSDFADTLALKLKDIGVIVNNSIYTASSEENELSKYVFKTAGGTDVAGSVLVDDFGNLIYYNKGAQIPEISLSTPPTSTHTYQNQYNIGYWDSTYNQWMPVATSFDFYVKAGKSTDPDNFYYFELTNSVPGTSQILEWVAPGVSDVTGYWKDTWSLATTAGASALNGSQKVLHWEFNDTQKIWVIRDYLNKEYQFVVNSGVMVIYSESLDSSKKYKFESNKWYKSTDAGITFTEATATDLSQSPIPLPETTNDPLLGFYFQVNSLYSLYNDGDTVPPVNNYAILNPSTGNFDFKTDGNPFNFDFFITGTGSSNLESKLADILNSTDGGIYMGLSLLAKDVNYDGYLVGAIYTGDPDDPTIEGWKPWQYYHCDHNNICEWKTWESVSQISDLIDFDGDGTTNCSVNGKCDNDFFIDFYFIDLDNDGVYSPNDMLYVPQSGSAAAAAVVASAVSAVLGAYPHLTPDQVVSLLFATADDITEVFGGVTYLQGVDETYGQGFLNLQKAVRPYGQIVIPTNPANYNWNYGHNSYKYNGVPQPAGSGLSGRGYLLSSSYIKLSSAFGNALTSTNLSFIALDEYDRAYTFGFDSLVSVKTPVRDINLLMNDFGRINRQDIKVNDKMSFAVGLRFNKDYIPENGRETPYIFDEITFNFASEEIGFKISAGQNLKKAFRFDEYEMVSESALIDNSFTGNPYLSFANRNVIGSSYSSKISKNWNLAMTGFTGSILNDEVIEYYKMLPDADNTAGKISSSYSSISRSFGSFNATVHTGVVYEDKTILGTAPLGAFNIDGGTTTLFSTMSSSYKLSETISLFGSATFGSSKISASNDSLFTNFSSIQTSSWNMGLSHKLTQNSNLGFVFSQPLRVNRAQADLALPTSRHNTDDILYQDTYSVNMTPTSIEYNMQMFYSFSLGDFEMDSGYMYRMNPGHSATLPDDHTIMMKFRYKM